MFNYETTQHIVCVKVFLTLGNKIYLWSIFLNCNLGQFEAANKSAGVCMHRSFVELETRMIPALVASSSGLPPAGGAGRSGGQRSSRQSGRRHLRDLLSFSSSHCFASACPSGSCCRSSSQRFVDAALSRELPADLLHRLANHLVFELDKCRWR